MVESPWGPMAVADAHLHFFSHRFFEVVANQKPGLSLDSMAQTLAWLLPPERPEDLARQWAEEFDKYGAGRSVLIASTPGDEDSVIAAVASNPSRFYGYLFVDPTAPDAVSRVQGALDSGHIHGLCLFPAMHRYSMHDDAAAAVLDVVLATRPATVVFVHCGVLTVGFRKKLGLPCLFDLRYSNPVDLHAIALRYPQIRFVIPHFGAGYLREALMVAGLCPNIYFDTSSSNRWMAFDPWGIDLRHVFRRALDVLGPKRLLFGTDSSYFPRGWMADIFREQAKVLYEIGLKEEDARLIFGGNLVQLLG